MLLPATVTPRHGYACLTAAAPKGPSARAARHGSSEASGMMAVLTLHVQASCPSLMPSGGTSAMSDIKNARIAGGSPRSRTHPPPASETSTGRAARAREAQSASTTASIRSSGASPRTAPRIC